MDYYKNKINGLIYGQALGDAIGLTTEFMNKDDILKYYKNDFSNYSFSMIHEDYHRMTWRKGDWTDDTDQFILIMQMMSENNISALNFSKKLINWLNHGFTECADYKGHGVGNSLSIWWGDSYVLTEPLLAGLRSWIYNPFHPLSNVSNGSLMRTSILGIISNKKYLFEKTIEISAITHPDPSCVLACLFVTNLIHNIIYNKLSKFNNDVFRKIIEEFQLKFVEYCKHINFIVNNWKLEKDEFSEVIQTNIQQFENINYESLLKNFYDYIYIEKLDDVKLNENIGHCFKPIACLCIALRNITNFTYLEHIIKLMSYGGDADTNCAIVGSVLGCYYGFTELPHELIDKMPYLDYLNIQVLNLHNNAFL